MFDASVCNRTSGRFGQAAPRAASRRGVILCCSLGDRPTPLWRAARALCDDNPGALNVHSGVL